MDHRLLFVDDDERILAIFKKQFEKRYKIDLAKDPNEGLNFIKNNPSYSVIIADMRMPGMNGIEFLEKTKIISPDSIRIMLTGNAELDVAINAINKGNIFKFLTKPCLKKDFENAVQLGIKKYEEEISLKKDSLQDPLTELWNRRYFDYQFKKVLESAKRYFNIFSIVFIDLNYFKEINDRLGHETGDTALKLVAVILKETCRKTDVLARYGGDEFIILLEHENKDGALGLIVRLKKIITDRVKNDEKLKTLSIAAGVSSFPVDSQNYKTLIQIADENMYKDKMNYKSLNEK